MVEDHRPIILVHENAEAVNKWIQLIIICSFAFTSRAIFESRVRSYFNIFFNYLFLEDLCKLICDSQVRCEVDQVLRLHFVRQLIHDRLILVMSQILVLRYDIQKNFCPETLFFEHIDDLREVFGVLLGHVLLYLHTYFLEALILPLKQVLHQVLLSKRMGQPPLLIFLHLFP